MPLSFFATPDSIQSFAQNYHDHLSYFFKSYHTTSTRGLPTPLILRPMVPFTKLRFHQAFHDAYDVVDEIVSATLVPPFLVLASAYLLIISLLGFLSCGFSRHNPVHHLNHAVIGLFLAGFSLINAMVNLFIRPILTLNGWNQSNDLRFCRGLNDPQDFLIGDPALVQSNPYCFQFDEDGDLPYSEQLELSWHQEIRPKLGFGND